MDAVKKQIRMAGWYGIENREAQVYLNGGRDGVKIQVLVPGEGVMSLGQGESVLIPWSEIPEGCDLENWIRPRILNVIERVCGPIAD